MNLNAKLDSAFKQFLSNSVSDDLLRSITRSVTSTDVNILIREVESLDDPSAYCKRSPRPQPGPNLKVTVAFEVRFVYQSSKRWCEVGRIVNGVFCIMQEPV